MSAENGGTRVYQRDTIVLEWQSPQERFRTVSSALDVAAFK
jgi:hypothetical protein